MLKTLWNNFSGLLLVLWWWSVLGRGGGPGVWDHGGADVQVQGGGRPRHLPRGNRREGGRSRAESAPLHQVRIRFYLLGFCHYPHRGLDTGQHGCKTTEYKSANSPLPLSIKCNVGTECLWEQSKYSLRNTNEKGVVVNLYHWRIVVPLS